MTVQSQLYIDTLKTFKEDPSLKTAWLEDEVAKARL